MKKYILFFALLLSACNLPGSASASATESTAEETVSDVLQTEAAPPTKNNPPANLQPAAPLKNKPLFTGLPIPL
ncbi:MAG: hypothetical protein H6635_16505 [Anaerolineales bacterium]|nr:hypothetical protein [Anaerolineales bacterium]MCB9146962.1 hypothetical protein [Anaerolineales bacterium]